MSLHGDCITIMSETSAKGCLFQQCANDVSKLAYVTGCVPQDATTTELVEVVVLAYFHFPNNTGRLVQTHISELLVKLVSR